MKKRILALLVLLLLFGATTVAFAYWDNLEQSETGITLPVGEGVTLGVTVGDEMAASTQLVPSGVVMKTGDVTSVTLTYTVKLDQAALTDLDLSVVASNVAIGSGGNAGLVNIAISNDNLDKVNATDVTVTVVVSLTGEPTDLAAYTAIANGNITFDLTFTATVA